MVHSANWFNYINLASGDNSGMLRFLTDELQDAEDIGDRGMSRATPRSSLVFFTDFIDQFGSLATFFPAGMGQMRWRHQVISVGFIYLLPSGPTVDVFRYCLPDVSPLEPSYFS
jgi:hypothetical protein